MTTVALLIPALLVALVHGEGFCPERSVPSADSSKCFQFAPQGTNFIGAEQMCRAFGGHLASIDNAQDTVIITAGAAQNFKEHANFWIGGNKIADFETWKWTDGSSFGGYVDWASSQIDVFNRDCVSASRANGSWTPALCCNLIPFVCEVPVLHPANCPNSAPTCPPSANPCPDCPTELPCPTAASTPEPAITRAVCAAGWSTLESTGKCYRSTMLSAHISWLDAEAACVAEGAHLASVHTKEENDFIGRLVGSSSFGDDPWLGAHSPAKNNQFEWTDGTPFDFTNWHRNEPNKPGVENCLELYQDTSPHWTWNNVPCDTPRMHVYVCKKAKE